MIVPMKKYAFLVYHSDYVAFLEGLRELGVLHVQQRELEPSAALQENTELQKDIRETLKALRHRIVEDKKTDQLPAKSSTGLDVVRSFQKLSGEVEDLQQELDAVNKEIEFQKPWGDFSVEQLENLRQAGIYVRFFVCPIKKFDSAWAEKYTLEIINDLPPERYFIVFARGEEALDMDAEEIAVPSASLSALRQKRIELKEKIDRINAKLDEFVWTAQPAIEAALHKVENTIQLYTVVESTRREAGERIMLLEGFVPAPREEKLLEFCETQGVPFLTKRPEPKDAPPVLLRNSAFSRLFEPIGKLFSLPAYREMDLTPYFAPFFMLFFGFCVGDAGYGIIILLAATIYKFRSPADWKPILTLTQFLGGATILFGMLTGTVFGLNLLEDRFAYLGNIRNLMLNSDQIFQLALILGVVQILFGLIIKAMNNARQYGWVHAIAPVGWIIMLLSLLDLGLLELAAPYSTYAAWLGVGLILLFNDPKAGIFSRLGKGVWELYGITGIFGDLLSYIRLFALGIASAILGFVVNDIALQIRDGVAYLGPVLFVIFLLIGHGINLMMASLGAFVHPMRLTFVEFYKNAGFKGGGKAYKPFSANNNER